MTSGAPGIGSEPAHHGLRAYEIGLMSLRLRRESPRTVIGGKPKEHPRRRRELVENALKVAEGCTHDKCRFCSIYHGTDPTRLAHGGFR